MHAPDEQTQQCNPGKYLHFIMLDLSDKYLQGMPEKVAPAADSHRPDQRAGGIEQNKLFERYGAHSNDKGGNRAQAVKKPKG